MNASPVEVVRLESFADWPPTLRPGALLLAADATTVQTDVISQIAEQCLEGALGVVVCWGPDCERVHDIFEETEVVMQIDRRRPPGSPETVMSTWHTDEPIEAALDMLRLQIQSMAPQPPHVVAVVGDASWLAHTVDGITK